MTEIQRNRHGFKTWHAYYEQIDKVIQAGEFIRAKGGFRLLESQQRCKFMTWYCDKYPNLDKKKLIYLLCRLSNEPITHA